MARRSASWWRSSAPEATRCTAVQRIDLAAGVMVVAPDEAEEVR
jgi:hypothetical protein